MRQGLPREHQGSPRLLLGPSEDQAFKTRPRQEELAGPRRQGPGKRSLPGRPSQIIETPASGVCREGRSRLKITSQEARLGAICAPAGPGERQASEPGKPPGPARSSPRQGTCPGELCCVPALQLIEPRVALGPFQGRVAGGCAARGTRWHSSVVKPSPWQTETQGRALLGSTATGIKCSCPPLSK